MAFYDWNKDGKKMFKMTLEYNIFKACADDDGNKNIFNSDDGFEEYDEFLNRK